MGVLLLFIFHFICDFFIQPSDVSNKELGTKRQMFLHCLLYSIGIFIALIFFSPIDQMVWIFLIIAVTHATIDITHFAIIQSKRKRKQDIRNAEFLLFVMDQVLHLLILFICGHSIKGYSIMGNRILQWFGNYLNAERLHNILITILLYILCMSPTAVFVKKVFILFSFQNVEPYEKADNVNSKKELINSGYLIGILERIIMLTLGLNGQLGAIGFVLAAKSLARFKQLEDKDFAEKYLVGTLISAAASLFYISLGKLFFMNS